MGAYLSEPVTEKHSNDVSNELLTCAASSMQGWRVSQEDAHNLILDFDKGTSLFAVYDGHGGSEVALYCADKLPDFIKATNAYKKGDMQQALKDAFLGFDASITERHVVEILKNLSSSRDGSDNEELSSEEDVVSLYQEAKMPLDKLLAKYKSNLKESENSADDESGPQSSLTSARRSKSVGESSGSSKTSNTVQDDEQVSSSTSVTADSSENGHCSTDADGKSEVNGISSKEDDAVSHSETPENGGTSEENKVKDSDRSKGKRVIRLSSSKAKAQQMVRSYAQKLFLAPDSDSGDSEDHDESFSGEASSNETEEEESGDGEEEGEEEEDPQDEEFMSSMREEPGSDSGCTAVVALVRDGVLYVANAGDSRCILCRNGQAVDMSIDHKPEDAAESERILNAGGRVTNDGRVNGGLNLSRAIGDHAYKQNKDLPPEKQMISAMPDVRQIELTPQDEFLVLACDGVWNYLTSQATVDFIKSRMSDNEKLSHVIEKMFDHCLAPNTMGDGTGCDNMTAIVVYFKKSARLNSKDDALVVERSSKKRTINDEAEVKIEEESRSSKKMKAENCEEFDNDGAPKDSAENMKDPVAEVASSSHKTASPEPAIVNVKNAVVANRKVFSNNSSEPI